MENANNSIQKLSISVISLLEKNFNNALAEKGNFATIVDGPPPSLILETNLALSEQLIKIGLINNSDYAFYSTFGRSNGQQRLTYYNGIKQIVVDNKGLTPLDFGGYRFMNIEEQLASIPTPDQVAEGYSFQSYDNELFLMMKAPFVYEGEKRPSGMTSGIEIGLFVFKKTLSFNFKEQGEFLGVIINVFA